MGRVWIRSLDADHFVSGRAKGPIEGLADPNHQGWEAVARDRPYLLDGMTEMAARARDGGKRLIAMSPYPMPESADRALAPDLLLRGGGCRTPGVTPWPCAGPASAGG